MIRTLATAALAATLLTSPAVAGPREEKVGYRDSDLTDAAARKAFMHRIGLAVEDVCGAYATVEFYQWPDMDACYAKAWKSVDQQLAARTADRTIRLAAR